MKIRTKLLLSYITNVSLITIGLLIAIISIIQGMTKQHLSSAIKAIGSMSNSNIASVKKDLDKYGKEFVELKAESAAIHLSSLLGNKKSFDYEKMRTNQKLRQIATADIYFEDKENSFDIGYLDLMDRHGVAVLHPNLSVEGKNFSEWKDQYPEMWELIEKSFTQEITAGTYFFKDKENQQKKKYMVIVQVPNTPFSVVAAVNIDNFSLILRNEIKANERKQKEQVQKLIVESSKESQQITMQICLLVMLFFSVVGILVGLWCADSISKPITRLQNAVKEVGKGSFSTKVEEKGDLEIIHLARAFNRLGNELVEHMDNLKKEVSARQAVESEVRIARDIQKSLVPRTFPPFPDHHEFSLYATLKPYKEVAGDFYDYFFIDENKMAIIIGDVSGKGIPAAFFMAVSRTTIKSICQKDTNPAIILQKANDMLCNDNDTCMFVTLFLAIYDTETGMLQYGNAGHLPTIHLKADGTSSTFGVLGDTALGIIPELPYHTSEYSVAPGDSIVLYTDGITEAPSQEMELLGEERFINILGKYQNQDLRTICKSTVKDVLEYEHGNRFDDITLVILKREE